MQVVITVYLLTYFLYRGEIRTIIDKTEGMHLQKFVLRENCIKFYSLIGNVFYGFYLVLALKDFMLTFIIIDVLMCEIYGIFK